MNKGHPKISVIIPTLQAENFMADLMERLKGQSTPPDEIIIIDSSSTDNTVKIAEKYNCIIHTLRREKFQHGKSRNIGASIAQGDILVFLTQDAVPANNNFLREITKPIVYCNARAVTARQLPKTDAFPTEKMARLFNYPSQSHIRTIEALPVMGVKTFFFSNSASAIERQAFEELQGFAEDIIVNEDMDFCIRVLQKGYPVAYQAEAQVFHSHNYSPSSLFKRYFDIGVFFSGAPAILQQMPSGNEGQKFVFTASKKLAEQHEWRGLMRLFIETVIKLTGFRLGLLHRLLPKRIIPLFSQQTAYWRQKR